MFLEIKGHKLSSKQQITLKYDIEGFIKRQGIKFDDIIFIPVTPTKELDKLFV